MVGHATRSLHEAGKRFFLTSLVLLFLVSPVRSLKAGEFIFDGQIRERFETLSGMNKVAYGNDSVDAKGKVVGKSDDRLLLQRIIAGFTYKQNDRISYHLHMYDARVWGWSLDSNDFVKYNVEDNNANHPFLQCTYRFQF